MSPTQPDFTHLARINFGALQRRATGALLAVANHAAFGVIASASVEEGEVHMPGALLQIKPPVTTKALATQFPRWIAGIAFREYITQFGGFLEEIGCMISLIKRSQQPGEEWSLEAVWQQINKKSFPDKLTLLEKETQSILHPGLRRDIERINRARNCFEHRRGIVTQRDAPTGAIDVSWRAMQLLEKRTDGQEVTIETLPYETRNGSSIIGRAVQKEKSFAIGSALEFTGPEIWEIGVSLVVGVSKITAQVQEFAKPLASVVREEQAATSHPAPTNEDGLKSVGFEMDLYPDDEE